jgi:hypothetical protein
MASGNGNGNDGREREREEGRKGDIWMDSLFID